MPINISNKFSKLRPPLSLFGQCPFEKVFCTKVFLKAKLIRQLLNSDNTVALFTGLVTWHHGASCGMAPAPLDPPSPPLGHLTHPHPHPRNHPHHPIPFSRALYDPGIHSSSSTTGGGDRKLSRSSGTLWSSSWWGALLAAGPASPGGRRRAAAGLRDPATRHVNTRSTRFFFQPQDLFISDTDRMASFKRS